MLLCLSLVFSCVDAANILMANYPRGMSHTFIAHHIAESLIKAGHTVTIALDDYVADGVEKKGYSSGAKIIRFPLSKADYDTVEEWNAALSETDDITGTFILGKTAVSDCDSAMSSKTMTDFFAEEDVDVFLFDGTHICWPVFADRFGIENRITYLPISTYDPLVQYLWGGHSQMMPTGIVPTANSRLSNKMTFGERVFNSLSYYILYTLNHFAFSTRAIREKYDIPLDRGIVHNGIVLVGSYFPFDFPRPVNSNFKYVGPLMVKEPKPLEGEWAEYVAEGPFILASLGTVVIISPEQLFALHDGLSQSPIRILWKLRDDQITTLKSHRTVAENIRITTWMPQNDLLASKACVAFLTHAGLNSVFEAISHAVPMVTIPFLGDQVDNMMKLQVNGATVEVRKEEMSSELIAAALHEIQKPSYKKGIQKLQAIQSHYNSTEDILEAVSYILDNGAEHLLTETDLWWFQIYGIDALVILAGTALLLFWLFLKCLKRCFCGSSKKVKSA
jgi:UDP:flavonoid glycosyltransferase YjiC (YdhE family)